MAGLSTGLFFLLAVCVSGSSWHANDVVALIQHGTVSRIRDDPPPLHHDAATAAAAAATNREGKEEASTQAKTLDMEDFRPPYEEKPSIPYHWDVRASDTGNEDDDFKAADLSLHVDSYKNGTRLHCRMHEAGKSEEVDLQSMFEGSTVHVHVPANEDELTQDFVECTAHFEDEINEDSAMYITAKGTGETWEAVQTCIPCESTCNMNFGQGEVIYGRMYFPNKCPLAPGNTNSTEDPVFLRVVPDDIIKEDRHKHLTITLLIKLVAAPNENSHLNYPQTEFAGRICVQNGKMGPCHNFGDAEGADEGQQQHAIVEQYPPAYPQQSR